LELLCAWLIIENNRYQSAQFFNSSNGFVASVNNFSQGVREYFSLRDINTTLAAENAYLRQRLETKNQAAHLDGVVTDSAVIKRFDFVSARIVNNSVDRFTNFMTINKGSDDGIQKNMAVISSLGAVGKVRAVSDHYAVVMSLLNIDMMVSASIKRTGHFGTIQWDGRDPEIVNLKYIPPHVKPVKGDTIVTSGYNAIFPEGILIGVVDDVRLSDAALFYELDVKLTQDFRKLSFVTVVKSKLKHEQDSIEQVVTPLQR
jgi:rod shape-determining protein MreC